MSNEHLPAVYHPPAGTPDLEHQTQEWVSGTRGGGKVPADYEWRSNPKVEQEENGANRSEPPPAPTADAPKK